MSIAREGLKFILGAALLAAVFWGLGWWPLGLLFALLAAAFLFFFRDPSRTPPPGEHLLVAPADGKVMSVEALPAHPDLDGPARRIAVFLSLTDVHLVRSPLAATVGRVDYHPGKFLPAYRPESSAANESNTIVFKGGRTGLVLKQIVGVAARRIKCRVREGQAVARGERIGLMYFGSRVEITIPQGVVVKVAPNDRVKGGQTVIAEVQP
jgi:phosphatidylserine decarboxylase